MSESMYEFRTVFVGAQIACMPYFVVIQAPKNRTREYLARANSNYYQYIYIFKPNQMETRHYYSKKFPH